MNKSPQITRWPSLTIAALVLLTAASCIQRAEKDVPVKTAPPTDRPIMPPMESAESFDVEFVTTAGEFTIRVHPEWAPLGAMQFRELVEYGYFDDNAFFRVVPGFIVQWGMNGDPAETAKWKQPIPDDQQGRKSNVRGTVVFATSGPDSRTTQLFINFRDNTQSLDPQGFTPFGEVIEGMDVVDSISAVHGESPDQEQITFHGNAYLKANFPELDYIQTARVVASDMGTTETDATTSDAP